MKISKLFFALITMMLLNGIMATNVNAENRLYIDDFTIYTGETKELAIKLNNDVSFSGFQLDIYMPDGLSIVQEDGEYIFDLTDRKGRDHILTAMEQGNGAIRLLCYSMSLKEFSGTSGDLVKFQVTASEDFRGNFQINMRDITFAQKNQTEYNFDPATTNVEGRTLAKSISLDKTQVELEATQTAALTATVLPETTTDKAVTWKSSDEAIAKVDANGVVTAIAVGEAIITATTADGSALSATCKVIVNPTIATSITLDKTQVELEATQTATVTATVLPELTTNKSVTWKSSNETIAKVDANGVVTAIAVGEATITATTTDGSALSAACKVIVNPTIATSITLNKTQVELEATQTATITATVLPELTTNKSVTWKSSDEAIATVDANGVVTAIAVGEATITATTTDGSNLSATCKVIVNPTIATSITLDKSVIGLEATQTETLTPTILPITTTNKTVTWKSSDETIATVDTNGAVTAIAVGEATITATTTDGSNLSVACKVIVNPTIATSITLDKSEIELEASQTETLVATVLPELTTNKSVTWKSSDEAIAIVDAKGVVTAIAVGEATITATTTDGSNLSAACKVIVNPTIATSITLDKTGISLKANETATLTAIVLPELTTNKSVTWETSDKSVATVDANGVVTAIGVGEATITATTTDGSTLSATCLVTVLPTPGDVNNDATINVTDVMTVASYILGKTLDVFIFEAADITKDSKINITDIVGIVNIILDNEDLSEPSQLLRRAKQADSESNSFFINDFSIQAGETKTIAVNLTNDIVFSGFQADIRLPEGLELCQDDGDYLIELSDRKGSDHVLTSALQSDGNIRLLCYSMGLKDFSESDGALVYLTIKASDSLVGEHEINISNIIFTQADLTEYTLEPTVCRISSSTGINEVDSNKAVITTEDNNIVIKNTPINENISVHNIDGMLVKSATSVGDDIIIEIPIKGVYIVTIGNKTSKVIL